MADNKCPCGGAQYPRREGDRCRLFWCRGCKTYQPWCKGGSPDPRCDDCVVVDSMTRLT